MAIGAGELTRFVELQEQSWTYDSYNSKVETWAEVISLWAKIRPSSGSETTQGAKVEEEVTHEITIRYRSGVKAHQRFLFGSRVFHILGVINVEDEDRFLVCQCVERI